MTDACTLEQLERARIFAGAIRPQGAVTAFALVVVLDILGERLDRLPDARFIEKVRGSGCGIIVDAVRPAAMPLCDSLAACFMDRRDSRESLRSMPAFGVLEIDAGNRRWPFAAIVVEPAVLELTTEFDRDNDGRRIVQARVAQFSPSS